MWLSLFELLTSSDDRMKLGVKVNLAATQKTQELRRPGQELAERLAARRQKNHEGGELTWESP